MSVTYIPYDYEAAYKKSLDDLHEWFADQILASPQGYRSHKVIYALKEITAGSQFEVEIYPQFAANGRLFFYLTDSFSNCLPSLSVSQ